MNVSTLVALFSLLVSAVFAAESKAARHPNWDLPWGDLGDSTYRNPILNGDFADSDVEKCGDAWFLHQLVQNGEPSGWDTIRVERLARLKKLQLVVANLRQNGQLDHTLILFLSDNGACWEWDPLGFDGASGPKNVLHVGADLKKLGAPGSYHSATSESIECAHEQCTPNS